jgi:hypothetical protein
MAYFKFLCLKFKKFKFNLINKRRFFVRFFSLYFSLVALLFFFCSFLFFLLSPYLYKKSLINSNSMTNSSPFFVHENKNRKISLFFYFIKFSLELFMKNKKRIKWFRTWVEFWKIKNFIIKFSKSLAISGDF